MINLISSCSVKVRPVTYPQDDNKLIESMSLAIYDKRPPKGSKDLFVSFSIGATNDVPPVNEARFVRVK